MPSYPLDSPPPEQLVPPTLLSSRASREKSAVREAITLVCESGAERLMGWMDKIEEEQGAKAAFDSFVKLLEFCQPKLSRMTVQDPDGNAPQLPNITINYGIPGRIKVVNDLPDEDLPPIEAVEE